MTVYINIGRRISNGWFRRQTQYVSGLVSFQENIWLIIKQSLNMARRKANQSGKVKFIITNDKEKEDLNYSIEWIKIFIQGNEEQEKEEYDEAMGLYKPLNKIFKKDSLEKNEAMKKHFKSKILDGMKVEEAYEKGYGAAGDSIIANKLLEMGILTHIELIPDYDTREVEIKTDF
jgi:hypothetical protein